MGVLNLWMEAALSLLAAVGLLALGWILFGRLLTPVGGGSGAPAYVVLPARGDGAGLEQAVDGLLWLQGGQLARFTIVLADAGLNDEGRAAAAALLAGRRGLALCPLEELPAWLSAHGGPTNPVERGEGRCRRRSGT